MTKVSIVTIAYNKDCDVKALFNSIRVQPDDGEIELQVYLHTTEPIVVDTCLQIKRMSGVEDCPDVILRPYGVNRGLSKSWNEGAMHGYAGGADVVIIANEDIRFSKGDIAKIARKALERRDCYFITCAGWHEGYKERRPSHGFSCFALNPIALERIGAFDENFFPIYFEDCDYSRRAGLLGLQEGNATDTEVWHYGSASVNKDYRVAYQNGTTFGLNAQYYARKWGGMQGSEKFTHPFNDPTLDAFIPMPLRFSPYGPLYDRQDQSVVVL